MSTVYPLIKLNNLELAPEEYYLDAGKLISGNPKQSVWNHYTDPTGKYFSGFGPGGVPLLCPYGRLRFAAASKFASKANLSNRSAFPREGFRANSTPTAGTPVNTAWHELLRAPVQD